MSFKIKREKESKRMLRCAKRIALDLNHFENQHKDDEPSSFLKEEHAIELNEIISRHKDLDKKDIDKTLYNMAMFLYKTKKVPAALFIMSILRTRGYTISTEDYAKDHPASGASDEESIWK